MQAEEQLEISHEAHLLSEFYLVMAKATHNMILQHVMRSLKGMLQENIHKNLEMLKIVPDAGRIIKAYREKIVSAIVAQDPDTARSTSNALLVYIETTLLDINQRDTAVQRAMRRIDVNSK